VGPASGFRVQGAGFRVQVSGFKVQGSRFRVQGFTRFFIAKGNRRYWITGGSSVDGYTSRERVHCHQRRGHTRGLDISTFDVFQGKPLDNPVISYANCVRV
jgi:hypothetical protein